MSHAANDPSVPPPESDDLVIWRYLSFPKFLALLENRSLFFPRVALLDDKFEGSFPSTQPPLSRLKELIPFTIPPDAIIEVDPGLGNIWGIIREWACISCWHASPHESEAMWRLYSDANAAIAIRSTVGKLRTALGDRPQFQDGFGGADRYHIGMVKYIDFERDRIPVNSFASQFFRKRKGYEHEAELRALLIDFPITADKHVDPTRSPDYVGRSVPIDVPLLLGDIVVGAQAPDWYLDLVNKLLVRYAVPLKAHRSKLADSPTY